MRLFLPWLRQFLYFRSYYHPTYYLPLSAIVTDAQGRRISWN